MTEGAPTEMEERCARALWKSDLTESAAFLESLGPEHAGLVAEMNAETWEATTETARSAAVRRARAVIRTLRLPTIGMLDAGVRTRAARRRAEAALVWQAMVDEASGVVADVDTE